MSSGGGFGPDGPGASGAPPFSVTGPAQLSLDSSRAGLGSFVVANTTGRPVTCRAFVTPGTGADAAWFQITGEAEKALPVDGTMTVDVRVEVPADVAPGPHSFVPAAALEDAPDQVAYGPTVAFTVPPAAKKRFPWWIVIVAVVALLLLVGGGLAVFFLTRPDPGPSPSPTPTERPLHRNGEFVFAESTLGVDLDDGRIGQGIGSGTDIMLSDADFVAVPAARPLLVFGAGGGVAVVTEGTFEACRDATLSQGIEVPDGAGTTFVCTVTSDDRLALMEITAGPGEAPSRDIVYTVWQ